MKPILSSAMLLLLAISANAADRFARDPEQISIATTGRIVKVDAKNKTFKIRGSDPQTLSVRKESQSGCSWAVIKGMDELESSIVERVNELELSVIPLLASPQGGVAERSSKYREASADREDGVVFRPNQRKTTPAALASVAARNF